MGHIIPTVCLEEHEGIWISTGMIKRMEQKSKEMGYKCIL